MQSTRISEDTYLLVTNKTKLSAILYLLREILPGDTYGFPEDTHKSILKQLVNIDTAMYALIDREIE